MRELPAPWHRSRSYDLKPLDRWHQRFEHANNRVGEVQPLEDLGLHIRVARIHNVYNRLLVESRPLPRAPRVAAVQRS